MAYRKNYIQDVHIDRQQELHIEMKLELRSLQTILNYF